jgi:hypothetical protein
MRDACAPLLLQFAFAFPFFLASFASTQGCHLIGFWLNIGQSGVQICEVRRWWRRRQEDRRETGWHSAASGKVRAGTGGGVTRALGAAAVASAAAANATHHDGQEQPHRPCVKSVLEVLLGVTPHEANSLAIVDGARVNKRCAWRSAAAAVAAAEQRRAWRLARTEKKMMITWKIFSDMSWPL